MADAALEIRNLSFTYPNGFAALKDINFAIGKGEFVGIIGQNGAGKSTLLKNLNGLLKPTTGDVIACGTNTKEISVGRLATKIGFVLQNPDRQLFADTVEDEVSFGPKNLGYDNVKIKEKMEMALQKTGMEEHRNAFPPALSAGERAKVIIASVIAMEPEVIILDEPTTGQDYKGCFQIMNIARELNQMGKTVIVVTHHMALVAEYASRTIVLCQGKMLMDGSTEEVFGKPDVIKESYVVPPQISQLGKEMSATLNLEGRTLLSVDHFCDRFKATCDAGELVYSPVSGEISRDIEKADETIEEEQNE